jgi:hypothetical protein
MPLLADTGILYALADADDAWHRRATQLVAEVGQILLAPAPVLPEVCFLLHSRLGPRVERLFVESVADGELGVEDLRPEDFARTAALLKKYPSIGFVDAAVVAVAERLGVEAIATTDRRDFSQVRPRHRPAFTLLP